MTFKLRNQKDVEDNKMHPARKWRLMYASGCTCRKYLDFGVKTFYVRVTGYDT